MEKYISMLVKDSGFKRMVKLILKHFLKVLRAQHLSAYLSPAFSALVCLDFFSFKSASERPLPPGGMPQLLRVPDDLALAKNKAVSPCCFSLTSHLGARSLAF